MSIFKRKTIKVPADGEKSLEALQIWTVRWKSRYGNYSDQTRPEVEIFTSEEDAKAFKNAIEKAYALIRHSYGTEVSIEAQTK